MYEGVAFSKTWAGSHRPLVQFYEFSSKSRPLMSSNLNALNQFPSFHNFPACYTECTTRMATTLGIGVPIHRHSHQNSLDDESQLHVILALPSFPLCTTYVPAAPLAHSDPAALRHEHDIAAFV